MTIAFVIALAVVATVNANCVPDQSQFYWKSPCDGQTFETVVEIHSVTATQGGVPLDTVGGFNLTKTLDIVAEITNKYGTVTKPLVDLGVKEYAKPLFQCVWINFPVGSVLSNLDACDVVENCHLENQPTTMKVSVNVRDLAGSLVNLLKVGNYYALTLTFKDDQKPLACVYFQDKLISH